LTLEQVPGFTLSEAMRSGELAGLCGVSADTLRHYERMGVLARPPRTPAGYRQYPAEAEARVKLVRRALGVGFTLEELARILRVRDRGGAPCRQVRSLAAGKLQQVEQQIADLTRLRDHLRSLLENWDLRLAGVPEGARAGLLEALTELPSD
jgi:DNA-binding transcriptional MerR regulator